MVLNARDPIGRIPLSVHLPASFLALTDQPIPGAEEDSIAVATFIFDGLKVRTRRHFACGENDTSDLELSFDEVIFEDGVPTCSKCMVLWDEMHEQGAIL